MVVKQCIDALQSLQVVDDLQAKQSGKHGDAVEVEWRVDDKQDAVDECAAVEQVIEVRKWVAWLFEHLELHLVG